MFMPGANISGDADYEALYSGLGDGTSGYLSFTFGAGNRRTFSYFVTFKRSEIQRGAFERCFAVSANDYVQITATTHARLEVQVAGTLVLSTTLSDTNVEIENADGFVTLLVAVDTTQVNAMKRVRVYLIGNEVLELKTTSQPAQNADSDFLNSNNVKVGRDHTTAQYYWGDYCTEIGIVEDIQVTPDQLFDFTDTIPKHKDLTSLFASAGTESAWIRDPSTGTDYSGKNNDFTVNGTISQEGTVPTNNASGQGNFATWSPLDYNSDEGAPANGNKTCGTEGGNTYNLGAKATMSFDAADDTFWEILADDTGSGSTLLDIGITGENTLTNVSSNSLAFNTSTNYYRSLNGNAGVGTGASQSNSAYGDSFTDSDVIGVRVNAGSLYFYKNGTIQNGGTAAATGLTGRFTPCMFGYNSASCTIRTDPDEWTNAPGAVGQANALGTSQIDAVIDKLEDHFREYFIKHDGTSTSFNLPWTDNTLFIVDKLGSGNNNVVVDELRGTGNALFLDLTNAEDTTSTVISKSGGTVTLGAGVGAGEYSIICVRFTDSETNSSGSITVNWHYNTVLGWGIGTYTGTGANATLGVPSAFGAANFLHYSKIRGSANSWIGYFKDGASDAETDYILLESTAGAVDLASIWNDTAPTSSVITLGSDGTANSSGGSHYITALWATDLMKDIGFEGNASADGPFVSIQGYLALLMLKTYDASGNATFHSSLRDQVADLDNERNLRTTDAEDTITATLGVHKSNGFKIETTQSDFNPSSTVVGFATKYSDGYAQLRGHVAPAPNLPFQWQLCANLPNTANTQTYTESDVFCGTPARNRRIVVIPTLGTSGVTSNDTVRSVRVGGVPLDLDVRTEEAGIDNTVVEFWSAIVPVGVYNDIEVIWEDGTQTHQHIAVYAIYDSEFHDSDADADDSDANFSISLDIPTGNSVAIGASASFYTGGTLNTSWSGMTELYDEASDTHFDHHGAAVSKSSSETLAVTITTSATANQYTVLGAVYKESI